MTPEDKVRNMMNRARHSEGTGAGDWDQFLRRAHRKLFVNRALASGAAVVLIVAAGVGATALWGEDRGRVGPVIPPAASETAATPDSSPTAEESATFHDVAVELWFTKGELLASHVQTVQAEDSGPVAAGYAAVEALFDPERPPGFGTAIPPVLDPELGLDLVDPQQGIVTVDLPAEFESGGGSLSMQMRVAQVVFTLTQFPEVEGVLFEIEGEPRDSIGGEGIDTSHPLTRRDFDDLAPLIVVDTPEIGQEISSPVTVAGTANTFEANVVIRILDENGDVLIETFTTATCGTGCRGDYSEGVAFEVDHRQAGTVEVLEYSAEDGSPLNVVSIPVTLVP